MDILPDLPDANELYEDVINNGNLRLVHTDEHHDVDYDTFISTRCNSTTDTIRHLISDCEWSLTEFPSTEIYQISFQCENDDINSDPVHSMIVCGEYVYQSYCNLYPLRKTYIPNLHYFEDPQNNWIQLTGDPVPMNFSVIVRYSQPRTLNLSNIREKCERLRK